VQPICRVPPCGARRPCTAKDATLRHSLLAHRLAPIPNAPSNITRILANDDEIRVAYPILAQSERLDDEALVQTARTKSQEHLLAISRRKSLGEIVTDVLVERGNQQVVLSTAKNSGARFSDSGLALLVRRSNGDDVLASYVGVRPDLPHDLFLTLLATASEMVLVQMARHGGLALQAADSVYGSAEMLGWLVYEHGIEPHVTVFDKSTRQDGTFSATTLHTTMSASFIIAPPARC